MLHLERTKKELLLEYVVLVKEVQVLGEYEQVVALLILLELH